MLLVGKAIRIYAVVIFTALSYLIKKSYRNIDAGSLSATRHGGIVKLSKVASSVFSLIVAPIPTEYKYNLTTIATYRGCKVLVRPFVFSEILMVSGVWEPYVRSILDSQISQTDTLVDVGANIGIYAIPYSKMAKKIIAFEPHPETARILRKNIEINNIDNIVLHEKAVGDSASKTKFGLSYVPMTSGVTTLDKVESMIEVDMTDLDTVLSEERSVDWLLIDVEGFEVNVLKGSKCVLKKYSPKIIIESGDHNLQEVKKILYEEGYNLSQLYTSYYYASKK